MKLIVLTLCLSLSFLSIGQTFNWDNSAPEEASNQKDGSFELQGLAHFYPDYYEDSPTALGEIFHHDLMTAGHQKLSLGTIVEVTRNDTGLSTKVRINDRGAYCDGCVIDLSKAAAEAIQLQHGSRTTVTLTILGNSNINPSSSPSSYEEQRFTARGGEMSTIDTYASTNIDTDTDKKVYCAPKANENHQAEFSEEMPMTQVKGIEVKQSAYTETNGITIIDLPISPISVQLGSYGKYANAERHILSLQEKGFKNLFLLKEARLNDTPLYRLIVAPFATVNEAEKYASDLQDIHQMKSLILQSTLLEVK